MKSAVSNHRHPSPRPAFTLVELLVVITIIAILIALLMPALGAARAQAKAAKCAANMRGMATALIMFTEEHDGHGPGGGWWYTWNSGMGWVEIMNVEYFKIPWQISNLPPANARVTYIQQCGRRSWPSGAPFEPVSFALNCPLAAERDSGISGWIYSIALNQDATGGMSTANDPVWGAWGCAVDPSTISSAVQPLYGWSATDPVHQLTAQTQGPPVNSPYGKADRANAAGYWLGARYARFNSAYQIMLTETAGSSPAFIYGATNGKDNYLFQDKERDWTYSTNWTNSPPLTGAATFAFRHPWGLGANFAFFDGHVERLGPKDSWAHNGRYALK